eukprot:UN18393
MKNMKIKLSSECTCNLLFGQFKRGATLFMRGKIFSA